LLRPILARRINIGHRELHTGRNEPTVTPENMITTLRQLGGQSAIVLHGIGAAAAAKFVYPVKRNKIIE
jgi:hypothetical protein